MSAFQGFRGSEAEPSVGREPKRFPWNAGTMELLNFGTQSGRATPVRATACSGGPGEKDKTSGVAVTCNHDVTQSLEEADHSVSVVIPSWNGLHLLDENLPSVLSAVERYEKRTGAEIEIVVVDDGSVDGTVDRLSPRFPEVNWVPLPENLGFAGACNRGVAVASKTWVALLNNDVRVDPDYFLFLAEHFGDPEVFAVGAKAYEWDSSFLAVGGRYGRFRNGFWRVYFNYDIEGPAAGRWIDERRLLSVYAVGGFATYRRRGLMQLGGFNEVLAPFHWEDVDLSYRGWKAGWEVRYEPRSKVWHRTSATIGPRFSVQQVEEVALRNRLLFHWVNLHAPGWLACHLVALPTLLLGRTLAGDLGALRAVRSALRLLPEALKRRREERNRSRQSDRKVARRLQRFYASAPIHVYYDRAQILREHWEAREAAERCHHYVQRS